MFLFFYVLMKRIIQFILWPDSESRLYSRSVITAYWNLEVGFFLMKYTLKL